MNWPDDFVNKIHCADALSFLRLIPDGVIDMCLTSPPYWGLRDYGITQIFGGDRDCEHEWNYSSKEHDNLRFRGESSIVGNEKNKRIHLGKAYRSGWFCSKCHAWKGQLGLEPTPEMYIEHLTEIFNEVKRVLKKTGTLWLNIGDTYNGVPWGASKTNFNDPKYRNGYAGKVDKNRIRFMGLPSKCLCMIPERLAWSLIQNGWILRNKIPWIKPNSMPSSVKDRFTNKWEYVYYFVKSQRNFFDLDAAREPHAEISIKRSMPHRADVIGNKGHPAGSQQIENEQFCHPKGKNPGDVWIIPTVPCPVKGIHFATFPEELCRKAIIPGCPEGGIVLDPFCGVGTACYVAQRLRRKFIGIDIKAEYCEKAKNIRLAQGVL